ncbi:MAG: hypothetical protein Q8R79_08125, partial [Legionellaceae bacterium]|nr:hypothetical protein [Legionellaceae bacterium]
MPTNTIFVTSTYPKLAAKYQNLSNLPWILESITTQFSHIFNIEALEECVGTSEESERYFALFDECVQKVATTGENFFDADSITKELAPFLFKKMKEPGWSKEAFVTFDTTNPSKRQMGFCEKFYNNALVSNLSKKEDLEQYAFHTLDMLRSAQCYNTPQHPTQVVELQHLALLNTDPTISGSLFNTTAGTTSALFIRCTPKKNSTLPQWMTLYKNKKNEICVYSESPIEESDWGLLNTFLQSKGIEPESIIREGMIAGLSVSSGMRAVTKWNDQVGGAGFSLEADYPSLLVEWAWLISDSKSQAPTTIPTKYRTNLASFGWSRFQQTMTQRKTPTSFSLMDVCAPAITDGAYNKHLQMRSYNLGLDWLLADNEIKLLTLDETQGKVTLTIPDDLVVTDSNVTLSNGSSFGMVFNKTQPSLGMSYATKSKYGFGHSFLTKRTPNSPSTLENTAAGMVLHVFRACAKQKTLSIDLPLQWSLNQEEIALITLLMEQNPFVCELEVANNHPDLMQIRNSLQHVFARNRWLHLNNYTPPLLADFWDVAAHYWVAHVKLNSQTLMSNDDSQQGEFRRCVDEMGIHGLRAVLNYLQREEQTLKVDFNKLLQSKENPPAFYAACPSQDMKKYTTELLVYLRAGSYFPFAQFHFRFVPGVNNDILDLLGQLNTLDSFQRITLQDCLSDTNIGHFSGFLDAVLVRLNNDASWACPILVPELEHASNKPGVQALRNKYLNINNILMVRARRKNENELAKIPPVAIAAPGLVLDAGDASSSDDDLDDEAPPAAQELNEHFQLALTALKVPEFPINRAGGLALQMQQQQQIKQERSRCLDHENEKGTAYQDVLPAHLVTYDTIDTVLGAYFAKFESEHVIDDEKAVLGLGGKSRLQNFFHTWINANPDVNAKHIIRKMTPDAAKMLLKYHRQLSGGLNPYNLPKGFYTQRDAAGNLVLGYKPTIQYSTDTNPLTLRLIEHIPMPEARPGDFRQFHMGDYPHGNIVWNLADYNRLKLFSQLQPAPADGDKDLADFLTMHTGTIEDETVALINAHQLVIKDNWHLFYALWTLKGAAGLTEFFDFNQADTLHLSPAEATALLLERVDEPLNAWANDIFSTIDPILYPQISVALGQVYFKYGSYGLTRFLTPLYNMQQHLGDAFFQDFLQGYLFTCNTFSPLMSADDLSTFDKMTNFLKDNEPAKELWAVFLRRHMQAVN